MKSDIRIKISDDLRSWLETQAEDIGCDPATWIRMLVVAAKKQGNVHLATPRVPSYTHAATFQGQPHQNQEAATAPGAEGDPDAWRGPVDDEPSAGLGTRLSPAIEALIEEKLASTALSSPPTEMFALRPQSSPEGGTTRALHRPPPRFSPAAVAPHLRAL